MLISDSLTDFSALQYTVQSKINKTSLVRNCNTVTAKSTAFGITLKLITLGNDCQRCERSGALIKCKLGLVLSVFTDKVMRKANAMTSMVSCMDQNLS